MATRIAPEPRTIPAFPVPCPGLPTHNSPRNHATLPKTDQHPARPCHSTLLTSSLRNRWLKRGRGYKNLRYLLQ